MGYELSAREAQQQQTAEKGGREAKLENQAAAHGLTTITGFPRVRNRGARVLLREALSLAAARL